MQKQCDKLMKEAAENLEELRRVEEENDFLDEQMIQHQKDLTEQ